MLIINILPHYLSIKLSICIYLIVYLLIIIILPKVMKWIS